MAEKPRQKPKPVSTAKSVKRVTDKKGKGHKHVERKLAELLDDDGRQDSSTADLLKR